MFPRDQRNDIIRRFLTWPKVLFAVLVILTAGFPASPVCQPGMQIRTTIRLVGYLDIPDSKFNTDVWGWVDPLTLKEYALVGNNATGLHIVDVSDPTSPTIVSSSDTVPSFDIKTWQHYVYTVDGNYGFAGDDGRITDISDPENPVVVGSIPPGHNLFIDDQGFMYLTFPGLKIFDLNPDPTNPQLVWEKVSSQGHDVTVIGDRLYDFHGYDGTFIYDISNRWSPLMLGAITDSTISFHHSGWTSEGETFLFINDELAMHSAPDIFVFDISDPQIPVRIAEIADSNATAHNSYRIGNYLHVAYYTAGYRVYDITEPRSPGNPFLVDEYDTTPLVGEGLCKGAWGCYPFSPSGYIYISDRPEGFFIFSLGLTIAGVHTETPPSFVLGENYPNPFNPETTIPYELLEEGRVEAGIFDVAGRKIRTIVNEVQSIGPHRVTWDAKDDGGRHVASGVYFCRVRVQGVERQRKMVLLR